ncbi:MAG: transketolase [Rickettsiaceae bacterium]|nr:transketolase [Rickettsiaceae bacterium]
MQINQHNNQLLCKLSNAIRILSADAVENSSSGHPGMPLGFADVMTVLAMNFLKFDPLHPKWEKRDRLVLSAGHGSMLLYSFYYLAGFKDFGIEDIKNFRQMGAKTAGHPEYGIYDAIETTTGPLGQGFGNSVGMALALKKKGLESKVCTIVGDGCLMEGISYEAASVAGHLGLNNLVVLFDDNSITIDGPTNIAVSENHLQKFEAMGWQVERVDGHDFVAINEALNRAWNAARPYFIAFKTKIAFGAGKKEGSEKSHGSPLGREVVSYIKSSIGVPDEAFYVPDDLLKIWRNIDSLRGDKFTPSSYSFNIKCDFDFPEVMEPEATRVSSGRVIEKLLKENSNMIIGSADLSSSNGLKSSISRAITSGDFSGNFIHYGVRESVMAAIMNGFAVEGFLPVGGTFLAFADYMRPGIRLSALMNLRVIYIMTHDSIGVGEDGPTHQPVEHLASLRAMPNLRVFRPADFVETLEVLEIAATYDGPSLLALTRQNVPQINKKRSQNMSKLGAYVIKEAKEREVTIFASGSELQIALAVADILSGYGVRVVSVPSFELFFAGDKDYIESIIGGDELKVVIEAASSFGWHKIAGNDAMFFCMDEFGRSAPAEQLFKFYGFSADNIAAELLKRLG